MIGGVLEDLTEGQRQCLRLVLRHKTSKAIARDLGISPHTVDQRLRTAMRALGATSRVEAAQIHASLEADAPYQSSVYQPSHLADAGEPGTYPPPTGGDRRPGNAMREEIPRFGPGSPRPVSPLKLPIGDSGGIRNRLGLWQRLAWTAGTAILLLIAFGAFLAGLQALVQLAIDRNRLF